MRVVFAAALCLPLVLSVDPSGCFRGDETSFSSPPVKYLTDQLYFPSPESTHLFKATFCANQEFLSNYLHFKVTVALPNNLDWEKTDQVILRAVPGSKYVPGAGPPPDTNVTAFVCNNKQTSLLGCPTTGSYPAALVPFDYKVDQSYYFYVTSTNQAGTQFFLTMEFLDNAMLDVEDEQIGSTQDFGGVQSVAELPAPMRYTNLIPNELVQMFDSTQSPSKKDIQNGQYGCWKAEFCTDGMKQDTEYEIKVIVAPYVPQSAAGFQSYLCYTFNDKFNRCDAAVPKNNPNLINYETNNQNTNVLTGTFDLSKGGSRIVGVLGNGGVYSPVQGVNRAGITVIVQPKN